LVATDCEVCDFELEVVRKSPDAAISPVPVCCQSGLIRDTGGRAHALKSSFPCNFPGFLACRTAKAVVGNVRQIV
jgi:hypothetical protein